MRELAQRKDVPKAHSLEVVNHGTKSLQAKDRAIYKIPASCPVGKAC